MNDFKAAIRAWVGQSRLKLEQQSFADFDLQVLEHIVETSKAPYSGAPSRAGVQRLLFLYCKEPYVHSEVVAWTDSSLSDPPASMSPATYTTVASALQHGWSVLQTPGNVIADTEGSTTALTYEFVLEKWEGDDAS